MFHVKGKTERDKENAAIRILEHSLLKEIHIVMWLASIYVACNWYILASAVNKRILGQILILCACLCTHIKRERV